MVVIIKISMEIIMEHPRPQLGLPEFSPPIGLIQSTEGWLTEVKRTGRPLSSYEKVFNIKPEDINGKDILDLGSGPKQEFANGLENFYRPHRVVSLDPFAEKQVHPNIIGGRVEQLPFQEESFDRIYAHNSIPLYLRSRESIIEALSQIFRSLKPGGTAEFFPLAFLPLEPRVINGKDQPLFYYENREFFDDLIGRVTEKFPGMVIKIVPTSIRISQPADENDESEDSVYADILKIAKEKMRS
ncbi:MAG: class I SAM-dependent methyltransferase [Patescibacteria group bacterium]|mgnify:CR=1 FL=1